MDVSTSTTDFNNYVSKTNSNNNDVNSRHVYEVSSTPVYEADSRPVYEADSHPVVFEADSRPINRRPVSINSSVPPVVNYDSKPVGYKNGVGHKANSPSNSFVSAFSNDTNHGTLGSVSINYSNAQLYDNRDITDLTTRRDPLFPSLGALNSEELIIRSPDLQGKAKLDLTYDDDNLLVRMGLKYKNIAKRKFH
jgi:hypothetical protein